MLARSPAEVIVYGTEGLPATPYLARFDGKTWSLDKAPFGAGVDTLAAADDGTLWAAAGGAVWKKMSAGAWESVPLPGGVTVQAVWPRTGADVVGEQARPSRKAAAHAASVPPACTRAKSRPRAGALAPATQRDEPGWVAARTGASSPPPPATRTYAHLYTLGASMDAATGNPTEVPKDFPAPQARLRR